MPASSAPIRTDPLLTGAQVGEILGYDRRTVRALAARGELRRIALGPRSTRYRLSDVEAFIERRTVSTTSNADAANVGVAKTREAARDHAAE